MMPFVAALFGKGQEAGSTVLHTRIPAGDMNSGSDRRSLAGDMTDGDDIRKAQDTI